MSTTVIAPAKRPEIKTALPSPNAKKIIEADAQFVNPSYRQPWFKLVVERGSGVSVKTLTGMFPRLQRRSRRLLHGPLPPGSRKSNSATSRTTDTHVRH